VYDRILVPTDGSPEADSFLNHAADLAAIHDANLHVMYVVDTTGYSDLPTDTITEGLGSMLSEQGDAALDSAEERIGDVPVERALVEGSPGEKIVEYADDEGCDLIVMGTHGRGGIDRLLLGSVAERVVRTASVPVLTVRVESEGMENEGSD
jgi:nucleotide-binding universal stress UspA family protein